MEDRFKWLWPVLLVLLSALLLLLPACSETAVSEPEGGEPAAYEEEPASAGGAGDTVQSVSLDRLVIIPETTQVVDPETTGQYLSAVSEDGALITFSSDVLQQVDLSTGNVLAIEPTSLAPDGLLRRVVAVAQSGEQLLVETEQATLDEAIERGSVRSQVTLTPADVRESWLRDGVTRLPGHAAPMADGFFLEIKEELVPGVTVKGEITVQPSFEFDIAIEEHTLKQLVFKNTTTQSGRLELTTEIAKVGFHEKAEIAHYTFTPVRILIGAFPIWLTPEMTVFVGVDGEISAYITTAVNQEVTFETGFSYDNGPISPINNSTGITLTVDPPQFTAGVMARTFVRPQFDVKVYGVAGPYIAAEGYLKLEAGPTRNPWWEIYGGVRGEAGIKLEILSHMVAGYKVTLFDEKWTIARAATPSPATGKIAFVSDRDGNYEIYLVDADGSNLINLTNHPGQDTEPAWSPDGTRIAFVTARDEDFWLCVYVMNADGSDLRRLTQGDCQGEISPTWSPDGGQIAFSSDRDLNSEIYVVNLDGSGMTNVTNHPEDDWYPVWSPDGGSIAFVSSRPRQELFLMAAAPGSAGSDAWPITDEPAGDKDPAWSPDGARIAFASDRGGTLISEGENGNYFRAGGYGDLDYEIYVMDVASGDVRQITVNAEGDEHPTWSPAGAQLAFSSDRDGQWDIYVMNADGMGQIKLTDGSGNNTEPAWSPAP